MRPQTPRPLFDNNPPAISYNNPPVQRVRPVRPVTYSNPPINARSIQFEECNIDFKLRKTDKNALCENLVNNIPTKVDELEGKMTTTLDLLNQVKEEQDQARDQVIQELQNFNDDSQRYKGKLDNDFLT